ncbi:SOS response-associated peptidase [uncultured Roseovarius sp.]|uniref:SOS response-associated peptidase n=1 Tax=uncultured Roseovarius sp. TaxID=293344 RepID=UPI0026022D33|nr:SOS response-associated peptidase [uncultured Roseovarius sp.]
MCGRIANTLPTDAMAQLFAARPANNLPKIPNFNICPTDQLHVVSLNDGRRHLDAMRWGFLPHWYKTPDDGPLLINTRAETIADKPAFRSACRNRRCLIPITGFYEWTKDDAGNRLPWYISCRDDAPLALAGVWQSWAQGDVVMRSCAVVTTGANKAMSSIHHRMPVVLAKADWPLWLGEAGKGAATLMTAAPEEALRFWRVDSKVNSNRASGAELIEAL